MACYAGIGSRRTPPDVVEVMVELARLLSARGNWTLRSGGAEGADTAFQNGALLWGPPFRHELYLPWRRFNGHQVATLYEPTEDAYELAACHHPAWEKLSDPVKALHARNGHIVLGPNLNDPVRMVVCWTSDGTLDGRHPPSHGGGTGQALRVITGEYIDVPVFNLARGDHMDRICRWIGGSIQGRLFTQ